MCKDGRYQPVLIFFLAPNIFSHARLAEPTNRDIVVGWTTSRER